MLDAAGAGVVEFDADEAAGEVVVTDERILSEVVEVNGFVTGIADGAVFDATVFDGVEGDTAAMAVLDEAARDKEIGDAWPDGTGFVTEGTLGENAAKLGMATDGGICGDAATVEREFSNADVGAGAANLKDVWRCGITNEGAGGRGEFERGFERELIVGDGLDGGELVGLGLMREGVELAIGFELDLQTGLEGLLTFESEGGVTNLGGSAELGESEGRKLKDGGFSIKASDAELFGVFDDERALDDVTARWNDDFATTSFDGFIDELLKLG